MSEALSKAYKPDTALLFDGMLEGKGSAAVDYVRDIQDKSVEAFKRFGVPYPKLERWKYSHFYPVLKKLDLNPSSLPVEWQHGDKYISELSAVLNEGDWVKQALSTAAPDSGENSDDNAFWYLSAANLDDGWVIDIPDNTVIDKPIILSSNAEGGSFYRSRLIIRLGRNAEVKLVEQQNGSGAYFKNNITQIYLAEGSSFTHVVSQDESLESSIVQNVHVNSEKNSQYHSLTLNAGSSMSRQQQHIDLNGEGAHASIRSSAQIGGDQHIDVTTHMRHKVKSCTSDQVVRNVITDKATGVFQGKVYVAEGADFTDGSQSSKALLLSSLASMHSKPELEIYADEVKCAHGATCGALDEQALFYARSRGIPLEDARALLIEAFLNEVKDGLPLDDIDV